MCLRDSGAVAPSAAATSSGLCRFSRCHLSTPEQRTFGIVPRLAKTTQSLAASKTLPHRIATRERCRRGFTRHTSCGSAQPNFPPLRRPTPHGLHAPRGVRENLPAQERTVPWEPAHQPSAHLRPFPTTNLRPDGLHTTRTSPRGGSAQPNFPPLRRPTPHGLHAPRGVRENLPAQERTVPWEPAHQPSAHLRPFPTTNLRPDGLHTTRTSPRGGSAQPNFPPLRRPTPHGLHAPRGVRENLPAQERTVPWEPAHQPSAHLRPFPTTNLRPDGLHTTRTSPRGGSAQPNFPPLRRPTPHGLHAPRGVRENLPAQERTVPWEPAHQPSAHLRPFPTTNPTGSPQTTPTVFDSSLVEALLAQNVCSADEGENTTPL